MPAFDRDRYVLLLLAAIPLKGLAEEPAAVTAKQLLTTPQKFNGKEVFVLGYFDGSRLFAGYRAAKQKRASVEVDQVVSSNPDRTYVSAMHWNELTTSSGPFSEKKLS